MTRTCIAIPDSVPSPQISPFETALLHADMLQVRHPPPGQLSAGVQVLGTPAPEKIAHRFFERYGCTWLEWDVNGVTYAYRRIGKHSEAEMLARAVKRKFIEAQ